MFHLFFGNGIIRVIFQAIKIYARHRSMLRVILGETLEHKRFFEQALAGRTDLLGRRADGAGTGGGVLGVRWIER